MLVAADRSSVSTGDTYRTVASRRVWVSRFDAEVTSRAVSFDELKVLLGVCQVGLDGVYHIRMAVYPYFDGDLRVKQVGT
jgi:hypothetical protein